MTVSFDYDKTVTEHAELAPIASALQAMGHKTYLLTGRKSDAGIKEYLLQAGYPDDMEIITKEGHPGTIRDFKSKKLQEIGADVHIDDDEINLPLWHPTKVLTFQKNRLKFGSVRR